MRVNWAFPGTTSAAWSEKVIIEKVRRGPLTPPHFSGTEHVTLVEATYELPRSIGRLLLSALRFHNFTTQSPHEVWMAIGQKDWAPKISVPPIPLNCMSGPGTSVRCEGTQSVRGRTSGS